MSQGDVLFEGKRFRVVRHTRTLSDGTEHVREIVDHPGAVTVLPLLEDGRVCLIRNVRPAVGGELIELPAGTLEPNEDPRDTALRELEEETGYRAGSMQFLRTFWMSPGILNEQMHLYLATGLERGTPQLDVGEEIETLVVPCSEAMRLVDEGLIQDAKTLVGLLCYERMQRAAQR